MQRIDSITRHQEERICICRKCAGSGRLDTGGACPQCGGSGRVLVSSDITTHIRPYVPEQV